MRPIFGREPALIMGAVGAFFTVLAALGLPWLDAGAAAAITALVSAGIIAATTRPVAPALYTGVATAAAALAAEYGLHLSDKLVAAVAAALLAGFALFGIRPQVTPADDPRPITTTT